MENSPLCGETVWLKQREFEEMEAFFYSKTLGCDSSSEQNTGEEKEPALMNFPLCLETVWLKQNDYEHAEALFHSASVNCHPNSKQSGAVQGKSTSLRPSKSVPRLAESEVPSKKKGGPAPGTTPFNYEVMLSKLLSDLEGKRLAVEKHVEDVEKNQLEKIAKLQKSLRKVSDTVQMCVKRLAEDAGRCEDHIDSIHGFLGCVESTIRGARDRAQAIKDAKVKNKSDTDSSSKKLPSSLSYKSVYNSINTVMCNWTDWFDNACKFNVSPPDEINGMLKKLKQMEFIDNIVNMDYYETKYPKAEAYFKDLTGKWQISNGSSEEQYQDGESKVGTGGISVPAGKNSQNGQRAASKLKVKASGKKESKSKSVVDGKGKVQSARTKNGENTDSDSLSLDGSLGSECDSDSFFQIAVDKDSGKRQVVPNKKKVTTTSQTATTTTTTRTVHASHRNSSPALGPKSKKPISPTVANGAPSANGKRKTNAENVNKNKKPSPRPKSSTNGDQFAAAVVNQKQGKNRAVASSNTAVLNSLSAHMKKDLSDSCDHCCHVGSFKDSYFHCLEMGLYTGEMFDDISQCKNYARQQLTEITEKIERMCVINGISLQLEELSRETTALMTMVDHDVLCEGFALRFCQLVRAFRHHEEMHNQAAVAVAGPSATGVSRVKSKKTKTSPKREGADHAGAVPKENAFASASLSASPAVSASHPPVNKKLFTSGIFSKGHQICSLNPHTPTDANRAGISSLVVLDSLNCLVAVDIINGCVKVYDISQINGGGMGSLRSSIEVRHPYYMTGFGSNQLLVSCANKLLVLMRVSQGKGVVKMTNQVYCQFQCYGVGWVKDEVFACAVYEQNTINLIRISKGIVFYLSTISSNCSGPELLAVVPETENVVYLERVSGSCMNLSCISLDGDRLFQLKLGGKNVDVWNLTCIGDKIICCNKQSNAVVVFTTTGKKLSTLTLPPGCVNMPFAIACSQRGHLYLANDAAWEEDRNHYVTTEINCFSFSK